MVGMSPSPSAYAELHCLSNFSFLRGASHPEELVARAAELGYTALAITDRNSLAGVVRAHLAAKEHGLHLMIGAEITPVDAPPLVLLAPNRPAYGRLARLITRGRLRRPKGDCEIRLADVAELGAGLVALVVPSDEGGGASEEATEQPAAAGKLRDGGGESHAATTIRSLRSARAGGPRSPSSLRRSVAASLSDYRSIFGPDLYLAATLTHDVPDDLRLAQLAELSRRTRIPLVAANAVHYHVPERRYLQDVLTCIREKCTIHDAGRRLFVNAERHLRSREELARRYAGHAELLGRTLDIAGRCTFSLDELRYEYPHELCPADQSPREFLAALTWQGAGQRYAGGIPEKVRRLLETELALIAELRYEHYFLTVWDLVRFARERDILCQGRGSAANSAVCYCLGVTAVDPARIDLLFERFISRERNEPPDIDVDFEHERREEVFQYIYEKYSRERAAITAEVITYRPRSAVRDVGKALGLSLDHVDALAKALDWWSDELVPEEALRAAGLEPQDRTVQMVVRLVRQLHRFPRHLSQHVGGFVITETPLCEIVPLENGAMPDRTFIEWDKDDIDALGILKVDCLALGMLTAISKCFGMLRGDNGGLRMADCGLAEADAPRTNPNPARKCGARPPATCVAGSAAEADAPRTNPNPARKCGARPPAACVAGSAAEADVPRANPNPARKCGARLPATCVAGSVEESIPQSAICNPQWTGLALHTIPPEDPAVYDLICAADTVGVFQIESRAQMSMLPRLKPRCFYDLVIEVAIVRPGPIQGGMIHPYLRRRHGQEPVRYPSEAVREVLAKTLGVPLFQEQVMRLAVVAAGFSPGEADQLRRSMAAWRRAGEMEKFQVRLMQGLLSNGYTPEFAEQIYKQIRGFGEYGFPESHAASFALLVYVSAWLKRYHPAAFLGAVLNSQPMGFYAPAQLVREAVRHGVKVLPVDVSASTYDCRLQIADCGLAPSAANPQSAIRNPQWPPAAPALRLGFRLVRGLSPEKVRGLEAAQRNGAGRSLATLARAPGVSREALLRLAAADAFRSLGLDRRQALWQLLALPDQSLPLFADDDDREPRPALPLMPLDETVVQDYDALGLSLNAHPISLIRPELQTVRVLECARLVDAKPKRRVTVVGLVTHRQRPATAKGLVFMTLEDETGTANLIVRPEVWERDKAIGRAKIALLADGVVERQGAVVHVQVTRLRDLSGQLGPLVERSRDFH
jgi:error-prone DNA polymerase